MRRALTAPLPLLLVGLAACRGGSDTSAVQDTWRQFAHTVNQVAQIDPSAPGAGSHLDDLYTRAAGLRRALACAALVREMSFVQPSSAPCWTARRPSTRTRPRRTGARTGDWLARIRMVGATAAGQSSLGPVSLAREGGRWAIAVFPPNDPTAGPAG